MVGHGLELFDAKNLAHYLNYKTHEASTSITQEPGWGPKDRDVISISKFSDGFCSLIRGHVCQHMFHEVVLENQDVGNCMQLVWLQHGLNIFGSLHVGDPGEQ